MKVLRCADVGPECDYVARGETEDEIMEQVADHARFAHDMRDIPPSDLDDIRAAIHEE